MKLSTITIAFPVFRLKSRVEHCTPRRPTVFEQALVRLVQRFGHHPRWSSSLALDLFQQVLLVSDADKLVLPALDELVALKVLDCAEGITQPARARVADLSLTEKGLQMLRQGLLPGKKVDNKVTHLYDPITNTLIKRARQSVFLKAPLPASVDPEFISFTYPKSLIQERIPLEGHDWFNASSEIVDVRQEFKQVLWKAVKADLNVSPEGELHVSINDGACANALEGLESDVLLRRVILPGLNGALRWNGSTEIPELDFSTVIPKAEEFFPLNHMDAGIELTQRAVHFVNYELRSASKSLAAAIEKIKSGLVVVCGTPEGNGTPWFQWLDSRPVAMAYVREPYPLPGCICFGSDGTNRCAGSFAASIGHAKTRIPWGYTLHKGEVLPIVQSHLERLEERIIASGELDAILMMAFWKPAERVWERAWACIALQRLEPAQALRRMLAFRSRIIRIVHDHKLPAWEAEAVSFLFSSLEKITQGFSAAHVERIIEAFAFSGPVTRETGQALWQVCEARLERAEQADLHALKQKMMAAIGHLGRGTKKGSSGKKHVNVTLARTSAMGGTSSDRTANASAERSRALVHVSEPSR